MRLVFLGTPEVAVGPLRALVDAGHDVALAVTQPDRKRGRGAALVPSPVKEAATELGIAVTDNVDDVMQAGAQLGVVVAYGRLIRPHVLAAVPMVNLHFSLLPRWRGAAPVERAILAGDAVTGVCLMALEEGLDTGPVYDRVEVPIRPQDTADTLRRELAAVGTEMLVRLLREGLPEPVAQSGEPSYAAKIEASEHHIDWNRPAEEVLRVIRLGRAWTTFRGRRLKVLRGEVVPGHPAPAPGVLDAGDLTVGTGEGVIRLLDVQPEGKGAQSAEGWRNGARPTSGETLGERDPS